MTAIENDTLCVNDSDKLLTVDDLCEYLVVSKDFIYDAVRQGRLRASRIARQLRFRTARRRRLCRSERRDPLRLPICIEISSEDAPFAAELHLT